MKKYLSEYFEIVSEKPEAIEIKSKYHYWRIIERDGLYFLHHKYNEYDSYHVQSHEPFQSLYLIRKYISNHDEYVESLNREK